MPTGVGSAYLSKSVTSFSISGCIPFLLEHQPQAKLNIPGRTDRGRYHACRRASNGRIRKIELRMIEGIKKLAAELHPEAFGNRYLFEDRAIELRTMRPAKNIAAAVAVGELTRRGPCRPGRIERCVEPSRA